MIPLPIRHLLAIAVLILAGRLAAETNSVGIEMVRVPAGSFRMGSVSGNWDEQPVHGVTITRPFLISKAEVTREQFLQFRPGHTSPLTMKALAVSWDDAVAYCEWLSQKEGRNYRLPTEAEWEYACRMHGTGDDGALVGMLDDVVEWCLDWYGEYPAEDQTDPVGPDSGLVRVLRGDKLDIDDRIILPAGYNRPANRAGMPADYGLPLVEGNTGFRIVQAPHPGSRPYPAEVKFFQSGVKHSTAAVAAQHRPDPSRPYFRKRYLLPTPPESWEGNVHEQPAHRKKTDALALHPGLGGHQHSAALEVLPNGDLLFVAYTCWTEYSADVGLLAARLRLGHDRWEMPDFAFDLPDSNDHAPLLWTDGKRTHLFWGSPKLQRRPPFQWITTEDSGATWSAVRYPSFVTPVGPNDAQPINTALRDRDGNTFVSTDGAGADSILWLSDDGMKSWRDPKGRTHGGHSSFALMADGKGIFALNGRKDHIDHYMTASVSTDGAKSFTRVKTPFSWGGSNQRASLLRLRSGRLVAAMDSRNSVEPSPEEHRGTDAAYVAWSDDDGATWRFKKLPGAQKHETRDMITIGYSVLRQGPDDLIHLVTTMNRPCLHFSFNEAWMLSDEELATADALLMSNTATAIAQVESYEERDANGALRRRWSAGVADDGRWLQHGPERWYFPDGTVEYEAEFVLGEQRGIEAFYSLGGNPVWKWEHRQDGTATWTQFWPDGRMRSQSSWRDSHADGLARVWSRDGEVVSEVVFVNGDTREE